MSLDLPDCSGNTRQCQPDAHLNRDWNNKITNVSHKHDRQSFISHEYNSNENQKENIEDKK